MRKSRSGKAAAAISNNYCVRYLTLVDPCYITVIESEEKATLDHSKFHVYSCDQTTPDLLSSIVLGTILT